MGQTVLAARFVGDQKVVLEDVDVPRPEPDEVLLRVHSCAVCGSDRRGWNDGLDVVPGHEVSGTIAAVGDAVGDAVTVGTRGVVYLVASCSACAACRRGMPNACLRKRAAYGFTAPGGFAEYVAVRADCFLPVDDAVELGAATALLDLFGTTSHAFARAGHPDARSVAVMGCGPIGLGALAVARHLHIPLVAGIDVSPYRLRLAERLGAFTIDPGRSDPVLAARDLAPDSFDVVIEAAGVASSQRSAIELSAPGGVVVIVAHSEEVLELRTSRDLIAMERTILGSEYFPPSGFADVHEAVRVGELDPRPLITHTFALERIDEACRAFFGGETGKVLVQP